jgi:rhodanese-related sulfurtransferase
MAVTVKELLAAANAAVPKIDPQEAVQLVARGNVVLVDVRDALELQDGGKAKDALHIPRGLLEFRIDPESPSYNPALQRDKTILVYCASGGRAALAGNTLKQFGYSDVRNLGGFKDWVQAGGAVDKA